jgi:ABC-2 type transport system ATP-binding protein
MVALGTPSELKRKSMKGELLVVECQPLGNAVEVLQSAPGVIDAAVFGNALHLVVPDAEAAIPQIKKYLSDHGITVSRAEKIHPTLEDVFVSLTTAPDSGRERTA